MRKPVLFILLCSLFISVKSFAQIDTAFWFAAPDISSGQGDNPVYLRLMSYTAPSTVTIWQPANVGFTPITVNLPAASVDSVDLTPFLASIENATSNTVLTNGLRIHASSPVGAIYEVRNGSNREFFTLKGEKGIGTDFYTPFQNFWANGVTTPGSFSSIEIVATQNATTVLITPRTAITGHAANATYSITLNEGETYSARDVSSTAATTLSGSIISSNKPIAVTVFTGAVSESGCLGTMGDQITTSAQAGTDFILHKGTGYNERIYILATQNNTNIDVYGSATTNTVINWSETREHAFGTDTVLYVKTTKPVYLWQASGYGCKLSGAQVPNLYCAGTYNTAFTRTSADSFALRLYTRTGFEGLFTLNGSAGIINATDFVTVPGTAGAFKSALIYLNTTQVPVNSYNLVSNSGDIFGLGIMQGSSSTGSSFGYLSEFISYPFVNAGSNDTICGNTTLALNGIVGGGSVTGSWSGTGFGTFQNGLTALTNVYIPSPLDTAISPIKLILSSTGPCPVQRDTIVLEVTPAPIVSASADQTVCGNNANVQLAGSISGGSSTGTWTTLGGGTFSPNATTLNAVYVASAADTAAGTVTLILSSSNNGNCLQETDTMVITITNSPFADAGAAGVSVCANNASVALSGLISGPTTTGKWTSSGTGIFSPNNINLNTTYVPDPNDILSGSVMLYLSSTNNSGCSAATDSILVTFTQAPQVNAGGNGVACSNNPTLTLSGSVTGPTTSGIWSGGSGTFTPNNTTLNATYVPTAAEISSGTIFLTLTSTANGTCNSANDVVSFSFVTPPFANFSATNVCEGDSNAFSDFSLQGFGSLAAWTWNFGDATPSSSAQNPYHTYSAAGSYSATLVVQSTVGCSDTVVKTVTVYPKPNADFTYTTACIGTQISVAFSDVSTVAAPDSLTTWIWDFGGVGGSTLQNPTNIYTGTGNFQVSLTIASNHGCTDTITHPLNIPPRPSAGFYYNTTNGFNVGALVNFIDSSSNAIFYQWSFGDGGTSTVTDPSHTYFGNGSYTITEVVSDSLGCSDTATAVIVISTVSNEITTLIPNAISPNGDGKNDFWKLSFINLLYPKATVEVYNKWGQQVFYDNEGYIVPFNGNYRNNGDALPAGSYFYIINLNDPTEPNPYQGSLLIVR